VGQQRLLAARTFEMPGWPARRVAGYSIQEVDRVWSQHFGWIEPHQLGAQRPGEVLAFQLGGGKFASGDIYIGHASAVLA